MPDRIVKILKQKEDLIDAVPRQFIRKLEQIQNRLYSDILSEIKGMDTKKAGKLATNNFNIRIANSLRRDISKFLKKHGYYEAITDFGKQYGDLIKLSKEYFKAMDLDPVFLDRDIETLSKIRADDLNFLASRDRDVINTVYDEVLNSIYQKKDWRELADRLRNILTDTMENGKPLSGLLKKYSQTYAFTGYAAFDRRIQRIKAEQYKIDKFLYSGSLIRDSREFCQERAGKIFTRKEIDSWNKLEWQGKVRGRDVWIYLGGWNCQHSLVPVTDEYAKKMGNKK